MLATNIAETSLTISDVVYVIDCGKLKVSVQSKLRGPEHPYWAWIDCAGINTAETLLTISNVVYVVDCGKLKVHTQHSQ